MVEFPTGDDIIDKLRNTLLNKMGDDHINFFKNLKFSFSTEKYLFVHAGIDPKKKLEDQSNNDYLWSQSKEFFDKGFKSEKIIVHGHTPVENAVNDPYRINVDTGCYFSGKLCCVCLSDVNENISFIDTTNT